MQEQIYQAAKAVSCWGIAALAVAVVVIGVWVR